MANEFVARNGIIARANSSITGTLDVSGNITSGGVIVATRTWVTSTALTGYATESYVTTAINNLVDAAPGTLDTLNELAAALGDDPNFATTVTNNIAGKVAKAGDTMTGELVFSMSAPQIRFADTDHYDHWIHVNSNRFYILSDRNGDGGWETPYPLELNSENNTGYVFGDIIATRSWVTSQGYITSYQNNYISDIRLVESNLEFTGQGSAFSGTIDLSGLPFQPAGSYLTAESDTLHTVASRGSLTSNTISVEQTTGGGFVYRTDTNWGGWARNGFSFANGSGTLFKSFGAYGGDGNSLSYMYIGTDYTSHSIRFGSDYTYFPGLDLAISNSNNDHGTGTYFRGSSSHFVLGLKNGNTLYLNYGNDGGGIWSYGTQYHHNNYIINGNGYGIILYGGNNRIYFENNGVQRRALEGNSDQLQIGEGYNYTLLQANYSTVATVNTYGFGIGQYAASNEKLAVSASDGLWGLSVYRSGTQIGGIHTNDGILTVQGSSGNEVRLATSGNATWNGDILATRTWVQAQGYLTSETDSQTLDWDAPNKNLSITNGNTVTLDGLATEEFVTSQGYITGYTETDTLATVTARGATTNSNITTGSQISVQADGGAGYVASRIYLFSHNNYRGAGVFMSGTGSTWFAGTPYTDFDQNYIIARRGVANQDDTAQFSNALLRVNATGDVYVSRNLYSNYVIGTYANFSSGNSENPTIGQIWTQSTGDDYLRKSTPAHFRSQVIDGYYLPLSGGTITSGSQYGVVINHTPALGDFVDALILRSTTSGNRAQIGFATVDADGDHHRASIRAYKGSGNYEGVFGIAVRQTDASHVQRLTLSSAGNLTIDGQMNAASFKISTSANNTVINGGGDWGVKFQNDNGYIHLGPANNDYAHIYTDRPSFYFNVSTLYAAGNTIWHAGNDGSGSGLDADLLDGQHGSYYQPSSTAITTSNIASQSVTYATNATRLYASDSPYRYGDQYPYYMEMRYDGTYWNLSVTPETPSAVRVAYADNAGTASSASSATSAGSSTNLYGPAGSYIKMSTSGTSYQYNYQVRENDGGYNNTNEIYAPQLAFHWAGIVASSIMMEASGRIAIRNNPGTGYEAFVAGIIYSSGYGNSTQWNTAYSWGNHAGLYLPIGGGNATGWVSFSSSTQGTPIIKAVQQDTSSGYYLFQGVTGSSEVFRVERTGNIVTSGTLSASGYNKSNWDTAYSWGNHATASYIKADSTEPLTIQAETVTFTGNVTVEGTFTESSSIRFKENIVDLESATEKVEQLRPVRYNKINSEVEEIGLIAEEVAEIYPEVVTYNEEGEPQGVQYQRLSVILLKAVQELSQEVNELKKKLN